LAAVAGDIELFEGDICVSAELSRAVAGVDTIFHEAAFVSVPESIEKPQRCFAVNVSAVAQLLAVANEAGVRRVVLASSTAVYGAPTQLPLSESDPVQILSPYAASKQFNETLAQLYTESYAMPTVALRYFNVYGPRQAPDSDYAAVIPRFIQRLADGQPPIIFGDGAQTRDFIFVADVVRANLLAAETQAAAGRAFNICSGRETSLLQLSESLAALFPGAPAPEFAEPRLGDVPRSVGNPALASDVLGFTAEVELQDGLRQTVEASRV
jgi:nucleoside-diphosphate-sugar epimerase